MIDEQEIIEEIIKPRIEFLCGRKLDKDHHFNCDKANAIYNAAREALQKGKELGKDSKCRDWKFVVNVREKTIKDQASKIAELEKENKELLETLQSVLCQACESRGATDTEPPEYDSMALSVYADGLRLLSKYKRFRIHDETGRRVIGYMR